MVALFRSVMKFDLLLMVGIFGLLILSLITLYSGSLTDPNRAVFWQQLIFIAIAIVAMTVFAQVDYHLLAKFSRWGYVLIVVLLLLTLFIGPEIRGAHRWLVLGPVRLQVSELAKLVLIFGLARWLHLNRGSINTLSVLMRTAVYTAVPVFLVALEPDLGSALMLFGTWFGLLLMSQARARLMLSIALLTCVLAAFAWQYGLRDFQRERVLAFLNPNSGGVSSNYNVKQSMIAIGSGGVLGAGLGQGLQSQLQFLPERHTDFIFASLAEELGFLGGGALLVLYAGILFRIWLIAGRARDDLGTYITLGVWWLLFIEVAINIGMNMGLLPVTGIPLPMVSAGGSSLIVFAAAFGVVQNILWQSKSLRF